MSVFEGGADARRRRGGVRRPGHRRRLDVTGRPGGQVGGGRLGEIAGRVRYRMLETIRKYGRDRLADRGETGVSSPDRHRDYYRLLRPEPPSCRPSARDQLRPVQPGPPPSCRNLRVALEACTRDDLASTVRRWRRASHSSLYWHSVGGALDEGIPLGRPHYCGVCGIQPRVHPRRAAGGLVEPCMTAANVSSDALRGSRRARFRAGCGRGDLRPPLDPALGQPRPSSLSSTGDIDGALVAYDRSNPELRASGDLPGSSGRRSPVAHSHALIRGAGDDRAPARGLGRHRRSSRDLPRPRRGLVARVRSGVLRASPVCRGSRAPSGGAGLRPRQPLRLAGRASTPSLVHSASRSRSPGSRDISVPPPRAAVALGALMRHLAEHRPRSSPLGRGPVQAAGPPSTRPSEVLGDVRLPLGVRSRREHDRWRRSCPSCSARRCRRAHLSWSGGSSAPELSRRELEVAELIARGLCRTRRSQRQLMISPRTAEGHVAQPARQARLHLPRPRRGMGRRTAGAGHHAVARRSIT